MASRIGSSFSCLASPISSPFRGSRNSQLSFSQGVCGNQKNAAQQLIYTSVKSYHSINRTVKLREVSRKWQHGLFVVSEDQSQDSELDSDDLEQEVLHLDAENISPARRSSSFVHLSGTGGKPGLISFYNRPYRTDGEVLISNPERSQNNLLWFMGPAILVASFIFPSLYLRRILSAVFEDSLLTDFLILFFTEALFYCGVVVFLLLIDHLRRPVQLDSAVNSSSNLTPQLGQRISSVAALVLSLIIPMVTMGLVWPWTGPAASATLAPYLVGIIVQFAFEQYARYRKSPSWPAIPIIFQVYRLYQLNRAAQLVTALSFTVRGAEMTTQNMAINSSLGTLLNVLQFLGVICIWSLSSFLTRFLPSAATTVD
ncbi:putative Transmembrane protein [Quillaja saponaria]|uniref:Transmembrane protein n=1 Tax=Quillaja saponaria TaxID=32244 RepID=A0AAD7LDU6_QUISA|nr:putative Transmembrane protein [Quillaja saponaria]